MLQFKRKSERKGREEKRMSAVVLCPGGLEGLRFRWCGVSYVGGKYLKRWVWWCRGPV